MPEVFRISGFICVIRTNDHPPPHVHIFKGSGEVVFLLDGLLIRDAYNISSRDIAKAEAYLEAHLDKASKVWHSIHGT